MRTGLVLNDTFFDALGSSTLPVEEAETLPPECYTDDDFFNFEKEAVFDHEWLCLGREDWVPNKGDYFTTSIVGEPVIIARNREGQLKAMSAVCQHRAMLVAEGSGNTRGFVCPYHHWTYDLDGNLVSAPATKSTKGFDKSQFCLPTLKVEVWHGFIFVNFDQQAAPLAPRLNALKTELAPYDMATAEGEMPQPGPRYPWNWKVMFENNNDGYHASKLHQGPLHDFVPSERAWFPDNLPEDTAGYYRTNGTLHQDASFNITQKALFKIFPNLSEEERGRMVFANIPPTLSLINTADMIIYLIVRADGPETHYMDTGVLFAPGASKDPGFRQKLSMSMTGAEEIMAQDQHVDELVQVGLRSRYAPRGRYSWQEGAQQAFNCWLVPRYQQTWQKLKRRGGSTGPRTAVTAAVNGAGAHV